MLFKYNYESEKQLDILLEIYYNMRVYEYNNLR
jgi:hypothetical protein